MLGDSRELFSCSVGAFGLGVLSLRLLDLWVECDELSLQRALSGMAVD